ncbi:MULTISPECIES: YdeI/OmpD-associated family protein [Mesonia]|uniref:Uncharacterized protein n=1 Tax=Mesonia oceanica TaxID=2687242 RepID=A0AC61YAM6_9FLAO|nr:MULTISPECIES: YdeI/OmpD-associated family protein [Mesonia]MAN26692.1 hypothetical protein [Mesonia sp.]MAQ39810.1 hypothetical protein [Mesonia sp.]MBJ96668.1 hypothetical protein [Flavobacteriaceae bacterium]VVV01365.1 hypothetical protein FVB9532_02655 [Mesonia oceanica]|tara:strand:- start:789 stop:1379 length:591 start_codon:yes stop_codon:yes gene_type:complete
MPVKSFEEYLEKHLKWKGELQQLRTMLLSTELEETIKWGAPIYVLENKNVVGLGAFKNHYALWFFNGALLQQNTELLVNAQEEKTKALRQIRLTENEKPPISSLKKYVEEAILLQKAGKKIETKKNKPLTIPSELKEAFQNDIELQTAFNKFTKGKQREFTEHIANAKREETRISRLEKCIPMIKNGIGLNDKYRK